MSNRLPTEKEYLVIKVDRWSSQKSESIRFASPNKICMLLIEVDIMGGESKSASSSIYGNFEELRRLPATNRNLGSVKIVVAMKNKKNIPEDDSEVWQGFFAELEASYRAQLPTWDGNTYRVYRGVVDPKKLHEIRFVMEGEPVMIRDDEIRHGPTRIDMYDLRMTAYDWSDKKSRLLMTRRMGEKRLEKIFTLSIDIPITAYNVICSNFKALEDLPCFMNDMMTRVTVSVSMYNHSFIGPQQCQAWRKFFDDLTDKYTKKLPGWSNMVTRRFSDQTHTHLCEIKFDIKAP